MSDAEATIRQSILEAHIETFQQEPEKIVDGMLKAIFSEPVRWSVRAYLKELGGQNEQG